MVQRRSTKQDSEQGAFDTRLAQLLDQAAARRNHDAQSAAHIANEALAMAKKEGKGTDVARCLEQLGLANARLSNLDEAETNFTEALKLFHHASDTLGQARVFQWKGWVHRDKGEFVRAIDCFKRSALLCEECGSETANLHAGALQSLGGVHTMRGEHASALTYLLESQRRLQMHEVPWQAGRLLNEIGITYGRLKEYDKAMQVFQESLELARRLENRIGERSVLENIGIIQQRTGLFSESLETLNHARALAAEIDDVHGVASVDINIGAAYLQLGEIAKALEFNKRALTSFTTIGDRYNSVLASINVAHCHAKVGEHEAAEALLEQTIAVAEELGDMQTTAEVLEDLAAEYSTNGKHALAITALRKTLAVREEYFGLERRRTLSELEVMFNVERAQRDREMFRARNEMLQKSLERKTNELTANALYLGQRTEFLVRLRNRIETLRAESTGESLDALNEVLAMVAGQLDPTQNLEAFETQFRQVHHKFIRTLSERFPQLTPTELRICSLLKLDLTNRDIAQLMNVTVHNIEMHRYRLRKKLGLATGENLATYLMGL